MVTMVIQRSIVYRKDCVYCLTTHTTRRKTLCMFGEMKSYVEIASSMFTSLELIIYVSTA